MSPQILVLLPSPIRPHPFRCWLGDRPSSICPIHPCISANTLESAGTTTSGDGQSVHFPFDGQPARPTNHVRRVVVLRLGRHITRGRPVPTQVAFSSTHSAHQRHQISQGRDPPPSLPLPSGLCFLEKKGERRSQCPSMPAWLALLWDAGRQKRARSSAYEAKKGSFIGPLRPKPQPPPAVRVRRTPAKV